MTPTEQKAFEALKAALKTVLGYTENWPASFTVHDCWKLDSALAREAITAANAVSAEQFCYCNPDVSLQMVSGGGAPDGYLGRVTLRIGDQYRDYHSHHQATEPAWRPIGTAPKDGRKIIVTYANRNGLKRTVMACWLTDEAAAETDTDDVGLEEGWYECIDNWNDYTEIAIHEGEPTHWMPLPAAPEAKQ